MSMPNQASVVSGEIDDGVPTREELRELRGEVVGGRFMLGDLLRNCSSIVFRATDLVLQRVAAIELLLPPEDHEWSEVDLMRSTAAVARRLRDHDRARVIDWGTDGEVAYVAIETDDGSDPTELLLAPTPDQSVRVRTVGDGATADEGGFDDRPESLLGSSRGVDWAVWRRRARVFGIGTALAGSVGLLLFAGWLGLSDAHAVPDPCAGTGQECFTFEGPQPSTLLDEESDEESDANSEEDSDRSSNARRRAEPEVAPPSSEPTDAEETRGDDEQDDGTAPAEAAADATQALRKAAAAARAEEEEAAQSNRRRARAERKKKRRRTRARRRARAAERSKDRGADPVDGGPDEPSPPSVVDLGDAEESDFRRDVFSLPSVVDGDEDPPEGYLANPFSRPSTGS